MKITTKFENNVLPTDYAIGAGEKDSVRGNPVRSFPFTLEDVPEGTNTLAITFIDYDAVPVCAFPWIHWLAVNIPGDFTEIPDDYSREDKEHVKGKSSLASGLLDEDNSDIDTLYVGPMPPDKDHDYTLTVYALDAELDLKEGFYLNEFFKAAKDHTLDKATTTLIGKTKA
ncbi:MAG: YbhB/YbcL family Raf kinase inhibitor-like protein [Micrococcaceae bacterium]